MANTLEGVDALGRQTTLAELRSNDWTLVWFHPQIVAPSSGCGSCSAKTTQFARDTITSLRLRGCDVVGVSFFTPEKNADYLARMGYDYPILSVDKDEALPWGVVKGDDEPWASLPRRKAFLLNPAGEIVREWNVLDGDAFLRSVVRDVTAEMPTPAVELKLVSDPPLAVEEPAEEPTQEPIETKKPGRFRRVFSRA